MHKYLYTGRRSPQFITLLLTAGALYGQTGPPALNNASIQSPYYFRQLQFSTDTSGNVVDSRAASGVIRFDGNGNYSLSGTQTTGNLAAVNISVVGVYTIFDSGVMTLTSPQNPQFLMNARAGAEAILGSTTESSTNTFDLFVAIPAPATVQSAASLSGSYAAATFELTGGGGSAVRSTLTTFTAGGNGVITSLAVTGHAANLNNGGLVTQTFANSPGNYAVSSDGTGTAYFGSGSVLSGSKNIYVSQSGNVVLGGSLVAGGQDFFIAIRSFAGVPVAANVSGLYWAAGIRLDRVHPSTEAYSGAWNGIPSLSRITWTERMHQIGLAPGYDFTNEVDVAVGNSGLVGNFNLGHQQLSLGAGGNLFLAAGLSATDPGGYSIDIGVRAPALSGTGVYIQPQGIVNAASLAPAGEAIAPGEFITIFGSGLAPRQLAATPPYPATLGGVGVTVNGLAAAVYFVSDAQLNILVPYAVSGSSATLVVTNNGVASKPAIVLLQATAPGVFSVDGSGTGDGAITHANGSAVNAASPARKGETVSIYLAGLGALTTPVADGASGNSTITNKVAVFVGGQALSITYAGLAPAFPGLYQINATIPAALSGLGSLPLAVQTLDTFHCQVNIQISN